MLQWLHAFLTKGPHGLKLTILFIHTSEHDRETLESHPSVHAPNGAPTVSAATWEDGQWTAAMDGLGDTSEGGSPDDVHAWLPKLLSHLDHSWIVGVPRDVARTWLNEVCDAEGYLYPDDSHWLDLRQLEQILFPTVHDSHPGSSLTDAVSGISGDANGALAAWQERVDMLWRKSVALPSLTLQHLAHLGGLLSPAMGAWFGAAAEWRLAEMGTQLPPHLEHAHDIIYTRPKPEEASGRDGKSGDNVQAADAEDLSVDADGADDLTTASMRLLSEDGPLTRVLDGFEVRPGQAQMVQAVADALADAHHLMVEAGTGTGKSLGYLIPSALFAQTHQTRVVVSTHTISLQDQIALRDFPTLRSVLQTPIELAVFKGRTHYVCLRKLRQEALAADMTWRADDVEAAMRMMVWLTETGEGSREELNLEGIRNDLWPRVQSETETCINKRCPFFRPCYYFRARSRAHQAQLVVTNHSLVLSDLKAEHRVLPKYDHLILDEAHHLEEQATKQLGEEVHQLQCALHLQRLYRDNGRHGQVGELLSKLSGIDVESRRALPALERLADSLPEIRRLMDSTFIALGELVPNGESMVRVTEELMDVPGWQAYATLCEELARQIQQLDVECANLSDIAGRETDTEMAGRLLDTVGLLQDLQAKLTVLCSATAPSEHWVVWVEVHRLNERTFVSLHRAPVNVARLLQERLFGEKRSVVLTSATLSDGGSFDFTKHRLGLTQAAQSGRLATLTVASPFRYRDQALLCVPTDVPELAKLSPSEAAVWLSESLYQYAVVSEGRMLVLFTSHAMLRATAETIREPLSRRGLQLFAQGVDGSRSFVLEAFRKFPKSVLFGAQSFWEGIDLPGDQLTTLVIIRLPFAPPTHPVTVARHERLMAEGRSPFFSDSLPEAIVRFRQGFGRLIRTVRDKGVVVVMDKRIVTSRYGHRFLQSVPDVGRCIGPERQVVQRMRTFLQTEATVTST